MHTQSTPTSKSNAKKTRATQKQHVARCGNQRGGKHTHTSDNAGKNVRLAMELRFGGIIYWVAQACKVVAKLVHAPAALGKTVCAQTLLNTFSYAAKHKHWQKERQPNGNRNAQLENFGVAEACSDVAKLMLAAAALGKTVCAQTLFNAFAQTCKRIVKQWKTERNRDKQGKAGQSNRPRKNHWKTTQIGSLKKKKNCTRPGCSGAGPPLWGEERRVQKKGSFCVNLHPWDDKKIRFANFFVIQINT